MNRGVRATHAALPLRRAPHRASPASPRRRAGFSLIELLINLAIVGALVGVALPFYQGYMDETRRTRARYDIETLRKAIQRHDQFGDPLLGVSLDPLLGQYLQELPVDPWGNDYALDGSLGVVGTLGADGITEGELEDRDELQQYSKLLVPTRAAYEGPYGIPGLENKIVLQTSRPFAIIPGMETEVAFDVVLVRDPRQAGIPVHALGFRLDPAGTNGTKRRLQLRCFNPGDNTMKIPVRGEDLVNFAPLVISITEIATPGGPIDDVAHLFIHGPSPVEAGDGVGGLKLERAAL